jgi:O-antigen/teichoic acid export membrane protein
LSDQRPTRSCGVSANLTALLVGRVLMVVCSIVSVRLYTQLLGPHEVGVMNLVLSALGLATLLSGAIGQFFHRHVLEWQANGRLLANIWRYAAFTLAFGAASCLVMTVPYSFGDATWRSVPLAWLFLLLAGTLFSASLSNALLYILNATGARFTYAVLANATSWGGLVLSLAGALVVAPRAEYWLFGVLGGQLICIALAAPFVWRLTRVPAQSATPPTADFAFGAVLSFSWPLVICMGLYWLQRSSYAPMMAEISGVYTLGLISLGFSIGSMAITSFDTLFKDYYSPIYYRAIRNGSDDTKAVAWNAYMDAFVPAVLAALVFPAVVADSLLQLLVSTEFRGLGAVVRWGAFVQALISVYSMYVVLASTFMDNRVLLIPNLWGGAIAVVSLYLTLPRDPILGTGVSLSLAVLTTTFLVGRALKKRHGIVFPVKRALAAIAMSIPLLAVYYVERFVWIDGAALKASMLIALAGLYVAAVQHRLSRGWLRGAEREYARA